MNKKILFWFLIITVTFTIVIPPSFIWAQEKTATPQKRYTLWKMIDAGGLVGHTIILLSVASLALVIEYLITIRRAKIIPQDLLQELEVLFEDEEYEEAMELCEAEPCFLTNVIGAGLPKIGDGYKGMVEAMESVGDEETTKLYQKISWIQLIGSIAPMLGLLGTVSGMMGAFNVIASLDRSPKPSELARGIFEALVTTCEGLFVAIPCICFYFYFRNAVTRITMDIAKVVEELTERFKDQNSE